VKELVIFIAVMMPVFVAAATDVELEIITADVSDEPLEEDDIGGMCSLGCAIGWNVSASSRLASQGENKYDVSRLEDGLLKTAWVEGVEGQGTGEYIIFNFPKSKFESMDSVNCNGFYALNGYCKSTSVWKANSRVKELKMYYNGTPLYVIRLHDSMNMQCFTFSTIWLKPGDKIKFEILEVYPGSRYMDTAISELIPLGAH